ncbi:hypothetical protein [Treponema sp. R80B11-R83G3]
MDDNTEIGISYHGMIHTKARDFTRQNPHTYTDEKITGDVENAVSSIGLNFAYTTYFLENIGLGFYADVFFPQEVKITVQGNSETHDWYKFAVGADILLGPAFIIYNNEKTLLSLGAGIHGCLIGGIYDGEGSVYSYQLGLGTNITGKYFIFPNIYVFGRLQLSYDFYSSETLESSNEKRNGSLSAWSISPCIGFGFKKY